MPQEQQPIPTVTLTIDGREVTVPKGTLVWQAAKQLDIEIPIYCYHPKMPPLGACRMCFVEIEKVPKPPQTSCTTECTDGMVVHTDTPLVKKARKGTLEFLLINHPLDCPICDKGGECELQDFTLRYGPGTSRFDLEKRHFKKPIPVSDDILLDRERCIACQRCVRFTQEIAKEPGLIMTQRGFRTMVAVDPQAKFDTIFSGNTVEICPVGALTAKNYRFVTRPWELKHTPSVCAGCSVGCNVSVDVRVDRIMRQSSRANDAIDDGWLCNKGRWDNDAVNNPERLRKPLIRKNGKLVEADWDEALDLAASSLLKIAKRDGSHLIGGIGSTHVTNEEVYLFQKILRDGFGSNSIDHFHGIFPSAASGALPWVYTSTIADIDQASHIILLGADPYSHQMVLDLRLKKALRNGAKLTVLSTAAQRIDRLADRVVRIKQGTESAIAKAFIHIILKEKLYRGAFTAQYKELDAYAARVADYSPERIAEALGIEADTLRQIAREIATSPAAMLFYDEMTTRIPGNDMLAADMLDLAMLADHVQRPHAGVGPLFEDANSLGARDMGLLPDYTAGYKPVNKPGLDYQTMLNGGVRGLWVMGANPARHMNDASKLANLEFLVVQDMIMTETAQYAHVVLPVLSYAEKIGTFTNMERCVQVVRRAMNPLPGVRADWEIIRNVATRLNLSWSYRSPSDILTEIASQVPLYRGMNRAALGDQGLRWAFSMRQEAATDQRERVKI